MKIRIYPNHPSWPIGPAEGRVGSALPLAIEGVPSGAAAVAVSVTNADGVSLTAAAEKSGGLWLAVLPSSHFLSVGNIVRGVKVAVSIGGDAVLFMGDLAVLATTAGDPSGSAAAYVPRTTVDEVAEGSTMRELREKVNELARIVSGTSTPTPTTEPTP